MYYSTETGAFENERLTNLKPYFTTMTVTFYLAFLKGEKDGRLPLEAAEYEILRTLLKGAQKVV